LQPRAQKNDEIEMEQQQWYGISHNDDTTAIRMTMEQKLQDVTVTTTTSLQQ